MENIGLYLSISEIERVKSQRSTFCQPKARTEIIAPGHIEETIKSIGSIFDVADESGKIHAKAKLVDAFVTTLGNPDDRLLEGYGFKNNHKAFQEKYEKFWLSSFPETRLDVHTELFVFTYEPA